jgi:hypothetical protein
VGGTSIDWKGTSVVDVVAWVGGCLCGGGLRSLAQVMRLRIPFVHVYSGWLLAVADHLFPSDTISAGLQCCQAANT